MLDFQLFRVKVFPESQERLFRDDKTPSDILKESILTVHKTELRKGRVWHIGNVLEIGENAIYFRIGRLATSTIEVYSDGNFVDREFEMAPYTHCVLDIDIELAAIAKKGLLASKVETIASCLIRLLNLSETAEFYGATFEIDYLTDPNDFIEHLEKAYEITRFWVDVSRPNVMDVNRLLVRPLEEYIEAADGEKGRAIVEGKSLKLETIEAVARSAASTGDDAGATIKPDEKASKINKRLKTNPLIAKWDDLYDEEEMRRFRDYLRKLYRQIREGNNFNEDF